MTIDDLPRNVQELAKSMNEDGAIAVRVIAHEDDSFEVQQHPDGDPGGITVGAPSAVDLTKN
jgi:hypothetical protein